MECNAPRNWLDNGWMLLWWCALNRDEMRRCTMECEDVWWNTKMCDGMRRCAVKHKDVRWNTKMHSETQRCVVKRKDAWWNAKMHGEMRRCAVKREDARQCKLCECGKVSWVHDGDVVLWSPVVMSRKIGQYQPVENWVSTARSYNDYRYSLELCSCLAVLLFLQCFAFPHVPSVCFAFHCISPHSIAFLHTFLHLHHIWSGLISIHLWILAFLTPLRVKCSCFCEYSS